MTPKPKDKPAGKVKLTKPQLKVLARINQKGEVLRWARNIPPEYSRVLFLKNYPNRVALSTLWALLSKKLITRRKPTKKTPWHSTDYCITPLGRRALKESSK